MVVVGENENMGGEQSATFQVFASLNDTYKWMQ